jgi:hypothetical protein
VTTMTTSSEEGPGIGERRNAAARLEAAVDHRRAREQRADAAAGTSGELGAVVDLHEAREQVAAREAWVTWIERDDL